MYVENLYTPSETRRTDEEQTVPLFDAIDTVGVRSRLAEAELNGEYTERVIGEAHTISYIVSRTLDYETGHTTRNGLSPESISSQKSDCFGYTMVLSECLEQAGIDHLLAYSNGHAFTVVTDRKSYAWMIDGLSPCLNDDLYRASNRLDFEGLPGQLEVNGRGAIRFSSSLYSQRLSLKDSFQALCEKNPWMKVSSSCGAPESRFGNSDRENTLIVSLFTPEKGRIAFEGIRNFEYLLSKNRKPEAYRTLKMLHGIFPEIDSRNNLPTIRDFIRELAAKGYVTMAQNAAEVVTSAQGQNLSRDIRLVLRRGDLLRDIGRISSNQEILERAIQAYLDSGVPQHPLVEGKIRKTERILQSI